MQHNEAYIVSWGYGHPEQSSGGFDWYAPGSAAIADQSFANERENVDHFGGYACLFHVAGLTDVYTYPFDHEHDADTLTYVTDEIEAHLTEAEDTILLGATDAVGSLTFTLINRYESTGKKG